MARLEKTMGAITSLKGVCGYCYTQLYDIEQEINGLYTYGRKPKFNIRSLRRIFEGRK
jgi:hypothetical protein